MHQRSPLHPDLILPELVVFDLDMCLWRPEMFTLNDIPNEKSAKKYGILGTAAGEGVLAVSSGDELISLFPGALRVLQDFYNGMYPGMKIAAASSADTPLAVTIGKAAMNILEVVPGVSVRQGMNKE